MTRGAHSPTLLAAVIAAVLFASLFATARRAAADPLGPPGTLVAVKAVPGPGQFTRAWKISYVSTGLDGRRIVVTGDVIATAGSARDRPVMAWAHPTSGIAKDCAPSLRGPGFPWIAGLQAALARGFVVTATDYPGLGSDGMHPYLVGISEGRAVLDSVRAAHNLGVTGAGTRFIPWGHSQGGHAALWSAQLAPSYAPELRLAGAAAAAPPTDLYDIVRYHVNNDGNRILAAYTLESWSVVYGAPLAPILDARSIRLLGVVAKTCIQTKTDTLRALAGNLLLGANFLSEKLHRNAAWNALFAENTPGVGAAGTPYFLSQGSDDAIVPPATTGRFAQRLCTAGDPVAYARLPGIAHFTSGEDSAAEAVAWMADRFAAKAARNDCAAKPWL